MTYVYATDGGALVTEHVMIPGPRDLEGLYEAPCGSIQGGAVVAHPHPLYGGDMTQPVVHHIAGACRSRGLATLRFNFRGVGGSRGTYDGSEEWRDVQAAGRFLAGRLGPERPRVLAGYSFGAAMALLAAVHGTHADALVLVAFPLAWEGLSSGAFDGGHAVAAPVLSLCGEDDDVAPPAEVEAFLVRQGLHATQVVLPGTDHFFLGRQEAVEEAVARFLGDVPALRRASVRGEREL